jgi:hypothetical protein
MIEAKKIVPSILDLAGNLQALWPEGCFAVDSLPAISCSAGDGALRHSGHWRGRTLADLEMQPTDLLLPKRRINAFYKTGLDQSLRTWGVDTVAVCSIA